MEIIRVKKLHSNAIIPEKAYESDAGFDLHVLEDIEIKAGQTVVIKTGLAFELPNGYEMQVRPRSGISIKTKLHVILGTVDSQYRGEVGIIVHNAGENHKVYEGDRIAQAVIQKIPHVALVQVVELSKGTRGANGFGSTGINHEY